MLCCVTLWYEQRPPPQWSLSGWWRRSSSFSSSFYSCCSRCWSCASARRPATRTRVQHIPLHTRNTVIFWVFLLLRTYLILQSYQSSVFSCRHTTMYSTINSWYFPMFYRADVLASSCLQWALKRRPSDTTRSRSSCRSRTIANTFGSTHL